MKFLIIAACISIAAAGQLDQVRARFSKALAECKETVGASDLDIDQYNHRITPESHAGKCMVACVNKKNKIQDENGKINPETAKDASREILVSLETINEKLHDKLLSVYFSCIDEAFDGPDECEVAEHWYICFSKGLLNVEVNNVLTDT